MKTYLFGAVSCAALLAACATSPAQPFGSAVREIRAAQTADPGAAARGAPVVQGADPELVNSAVKAMRTEAEPTKDARREMTISVGSPR